MDAGARLAFTYQGERLKENVESLTNATHAGLILLSCDVTNQAKSTARSHASEKSLADLIS